MTDIVFAASLNVHPEMHVKPPAVKVALVSMPFVTVFRPSIQLGLLKSIAVKGGYVVDTFHFNLDFAGYIGIPIHEVLCGHRSALYGEWLFAEAAFGSPVPKHGGSAETLSGDMSVIFQDPAAPFHSLDEIRTVAVPKFLENLLREVSWENYQIVGFTSTFQQNLASFALARLIKEKWPTITTIFGGANFEGEMGKELVRTLDCIDFAVSGEGDVTFLEFLRAFSTGGDPSCVPGVLTKNKLGNMLTDVGGLSSQMSSLPVPDYDEYFCRAERLGILSPAQRRSISLPYESSRGCWWGAKQHCTFCGLNGMQMRFRSKTAAVVISDLAQLTAKYRTWRFQFVDNILDSHFFSSLLPTIIEQGSDFRIFCEVKSNLRREQLKLLRDAGVREIQPGIESLSSSVLRLMRKGVTALQNINTLRWGTYYQIRTGWNILWGFPGEDEAECTTQLRLITTLTHLQPPANAGRIWIERFSPLFSDPVTFPRRKMTPVCGYSHLYPDHVDINKVAYFFEAEFENALSDTAYEGVKQAVENWQKQWKNKIKPSLTFWYCPGLVCIEDRRQRDTSSRIFFEGLAADLYAACSDNPISVSRLCHLYGYKAEQIVSLLDEMCERAVCVREDATYLSLALPATDLR